MLLVMPFSQCQGNFNFLAASSGSSASSGGSPSLKRMEVFILRLMFSKDI